MEKVEKRMLKKMFALLTACVLLLSCCATALADDVLRPGDKGDKVVALQQKLAEYGYYTGAIDGVYGSGTTAAVKAFQARHNLAQDGKAGPATMRVLNGSNVTPMPKDEGNKQTEANKHIQERLKHYGFYNGAIDGVYGKETVAAVKAFQEANGLAVDGVVGTKTLAKLDSDTAISKTDAENERNSWLRKGDKGDAVKTLQQHLSDTLYYGGKIDGVFDDDVHNAVVSFQTSAGIKADGVVGKSTRNALYNRAAKIFNGGVPVRNLSSGMRGYDVKVLQQRLAALNYFNSPVTGVYNQNTINAVRAFQADNGLDQDGVTDAIVRRHLWPTTPENNPDVYPKLRRGDVGTYVTQAQMRLIAAGYLDAPADGEFGSEMYAAVKAFQTAKGLKADGVIGSKTWAALMDVDLSGAEPDPTKPMNTVLRPGAKGAQVRELQTNLTALGYTLKVDGVYGEKTTAAVKAFQQDNGLTVDGKAGPQTIAKINELLSR